MSMIMVIILLIVMVIILQLMHLLSLKLSNIMGLDFNLIILLINYFINDGWVLGLLLF
jgi:hypothetical protein